MVVTRNVSSSVEVKSPVSTETPKKKKKVKFGEDVNITPDKSDAAPLHAHEDEGIDLAFSPKTPTNILKPKHPLQHSWTFWYSAGNKHVSWEQNQIKIATVSTIEDFWFVYKQVQPASCLTPGHTYSMFRGDILPDWDHEANKSGGRWMATFPKHERQDLLETRWMEALIMILGEHLGPTGTRLIKGAEVCVRKKGDRVEVWVGAMDMSGIVEIGREMRKRLLCDSKEKIQFSIHQEEIDGSVGTSLVL